MNVVFEGVSMLYPTEAHETFSRLTVHLGRGWTGVVGPQGSGKTTFLHLAAGEMEPTAGKIRIPGKAVYCCHDLMEAPADLHELLQTPDGIAAALVGKLSLDPDWAEAWPQLSRSQRRRAQIACALWSQPDVLAVDEPTTGLDAPTRDRIAAALSGFRGIGLLASHDRELLDRLCATCLMLGQGTAILRKGNYSQARAIAQREQETLRRHKQSANRELASLSATVEARREAAQQANIKRSKRHLDPKDSDARQKLDQGRKAGKDARAGQLLRQLQGRLAQAAQRADAIEVIAETPLPPELRGRVAPVPVLWHTPGGALTLREGRVIQLPHLEIKPQDRIGLTGPSGSGKTALLEHMVHTLSLEASPVLYLPQEITPEQAASAHAQLRKLPEDKLPAVMSVVIALGGAPEHLLAADTFTTPDAKRLLLASGLLRNPHLILVDDPSLDLDLPSIERLETLLQQTTCALVLATHDTPMLDKLTAIRWTMPLEALRS